MSDHRLPTDYQPDIHMSIDRTPKGDYRCTLYAPQRVITGEPPKQYVTAWAVEEVFTSKKLPDFMWQLAKRIMPK